MKNLFYLFLIVGLIAFSCKKSADTPSMQDVVFKAISSSSFNNTDCENPMAVYAILDIDNIIHTLEVSYIDGVIYTSKLKLAPGNYSLKSFTLINDGGTPGYTPVSVADDFIVQATPLRDSEYEPSVEMALPFEFDVDASSKLDINIDILCFVPDNYMLFGFKSAIPSDGEMHFTAGTTLVREVCFFGDFCTKYYLDYEESAYADQVNGLEHDMPAIFQIEVWRSHEGVCDSITTFNNEEFLGEGYPLCVKYPDLVGIEDLIEFKLSILVKVGEDFEYVYFHTFSTTDAKPLTNIGEDNVLDFALGTCVQETDLILPPYMNLPTQAEMQTYDIPMAPGSLGTYFDVSLSGIGLGYDIGDFMYGVYCADYKANIFIPYSYTVDVYSSLYPSLLPNSFIDQKDAFDNINWLINNFYRYGEKGVDYTWKDIQNAVWIIMNQISTTTDAVDTGIPTNIAIKMAADAVANGEGFLPQVGGWAAVLFVDPLANDNDKGWQMLFILVDP